MMRFEFLISVVDFPADYAGVFGIHAARRLTMC